MVIEGAGNGVVRIAGRLALLSLLAGSLAACGLSPTSSKNGKIDAKLGVAASPRVASKSIPRGGGRHQVGKPYKVAGRWYHPKDRKPGYDEVGMASWYGEDFHGRLTANGEVFDMNRLSAAHPTLPLPSYVRVTSADSGRSVVVRVNDRGPFAHNRIIDLSRRAAEVLELREKGVARVHVQYIGRANLDGRDDKFLLASVRGPRDRRPIRGLPRAVEPAATQVAGLAPRPRSAPQRMPVAVADSGWPPYTSGQESAGQQLDAYGSMNELRRQMGSYVAPIAVHAGPRSSHSPRIAPRIPPAEVLRSSYVAELRIERAFEAIDALRAEP